MGVSKGLTAIACAAAGLMSVVACERDPDPSRVAPAATSVTVASGPALDSAPAPAAAATTVAAAAGPGPGDWGTLTDVCGPREGGDTAVDASGGDTQGIAATSIAVGTIADPGFAGSPGLNQEIFDAATAFVGWCNRAGGINGRQLELTTYDAALTNYQPVVEQACGHEFAIVGDGAVQDNLWPSVGAACGLIDVAGFSVTGAKAGKAGRTPAEERTVQAVPNPSDRLPVAADLLLDAAFPDAAARTGIIWADFQTTVEQADKERAALSQLGHQIVYENVFNVLGEANWTPFAVALKDAGVRFLRFVGDVENAARFQDALQEIGYRPEVVVQETNFYDRNYLSAGGEAIEGTFVRTVFSPFEEADQNPATSRYLDEIARVHGKTAVLGLQSTSAWLLFATLAKRCDLAGTLTRSCILEQASSVTEWDGGGLHAPGDPAHNLPPSCVAVVQVQHGEFVRWAPDHGYSCPDGAVAELGGSGSG